VKTTSNQFVLYGLGNYKATVDKIIAELGIPNNTDNGYDLKLILTETLTNAFVHGNKSCVDKPIYLRYYYNGINVRFEIEDSGNGFDSVVIPKCITDENLLDECGRGLLLINLVANKVEFRKNTIIIEKEITRSDNNELQWRI